jgi:DnaD/phage-associated family protein
MESFKGFKANTERGAFIPPEFFSNILPKIQDLYVLKTTLYIIWFIYQNESEFPYVTTNQLEMDALFLSGLGVSEVEQLNNLHKSIKRAIENNILLDPNIILNRDDLPLYFLNTPKGKHAIKLLKNGSLKIVLENDSPVKLTEARPNIFQIYEENIGVITPIIAETLTDLEETYPREWIDEAIKEAIKNNVRKLRYIEVILKNWQEEGKYERTDRRRSQKDEEEYDPDQYIDGEFSDFIDH